MFKLLLLGLVCLFSGLEGTVCYSEYWQQAYLEMWKNNSIALGTYLRLETKNQWKNFRSILLSEQLFCRVTDNFSIKFHFTYIYGRSVESQTPWIWQKRLEIEGNRVFQLPCKSLIQTRNRLEIRRVQGESKTYYRLRQLTMLVIPFKTKGMLKSFSLYNELFYDITTRLFNQNRLYFFQLTFELSDKANLAVFSLARFFLSQEKWRRSIIFGTQLNF